MAPDPRQPAPGNKITEVVIPVRVQVEHPDTKDLTKEEIKEALSQAVTFPARFKADGENCQVQWFELEDD